MHFSAQNEGRRNDGMDLLLGRSRGRFEQDLGGLRTPQAEDVPQGRSRTRDGPRNPSRSGSNRSEQNAKDLRELMTGFGETQGAFREM